MSQEQKAVWKLLGVLVVLASTTAVIMSQIQPIVQ